jgi:hypothetical protein
MSLDTDNREAIVNILHVLDSHQEINKRQIEIDSNTTGMINQLTADLMAEITALKVRVEELEAKN